jgi:hypothetical protein
MPISDGTASRQSERSNRKGGGKSAEGGSKDARQQYNLISYDAAVKDDRHCNHGLCDPKPAVKTQQAQANANDNEFPDDEMISECSDCPRDNRIELDTSAIQNQDSENGIQNI